MSKDQDRPATAASGRSRRLAWGLYALCGLLLLADLFYDKHPYFEVERWFGFYAFFGLLAFVLMLGLAVLLRRIVHRSEDDDAGKRRGTHD